MSSLSSIKPRGTRIACALRSSDGASGLYSVYPGEQPKSVGTIEAIKWDRKPTGPIVHGAFTIIGEMGMTGQVIMLDQPKWDALKRAGLERHFYGAMLWGGTPLKVVDDALVMSRRG